MEERWSGWDGAAPPPFGGEPRRRLLHPQYVQFSRTFLLRHAVF
jgi:hypothetical protein